MQVLLEATLISESSSGLIWLRLLKAASSMWLSKALAVDVPGRVNTIMITRVLRVPLYLPTTVFGLFNARLLSCFWGLLGSSWAV